MFMADSVKQKNAWNSWNPLLPFPSLTGEAADSSEDGRKEGCSEEEDEECADCDDDEESDDNDSDIEELVDLTATVESAISKLRSAQQVVTQMCGSGAPLFGGSRVRFRSSIPMYHLNQSACEYEDDATDANYYSPSNQQPPHHCGQQLQKPSHLCASSKQETDENQGEGWHQSLVRGSGVEMESEAEATVPAKDAQLSDCMAGSGGASEDTWRTWSSKSAFKKQPIHNSPQQTLTTCQEDVIAQRLNACLQLLLGGPYQECNQCVKTLSSCDQKPLYYRDLPDRLNNLETLVLYLQVHFRSRMSCTKLKLLCQLKKTLGCMHGFLLRRQAEEAAENACLLHKWLDRTSNFRQHWRPVPQGGEHSRIVAEQTECVPRVSPEDEWLFKFLPDSDKTSLGHILTDSDPKVPENLGRRMAYTKLRGRSTRLHNTCTRDSYEDMLRRFQFALR